jgi:hypothetical protein
VVASTLIGYGGVRCCWDKDMEEAIAIDYFLYTDV